MEFTARLGNALCIFVNKLCGHANNLAMYIAVHMLEVEEIEIGVGQGLLHNLPLGIASSIQRCADALFLQALEHCNGELGLAKSLTAGDCDAATGELIKALVSQSLFHDLIHGVFLPADIEGVGVADLGAFTAVTAEVALDMDILNGLLGLAVDAHGALLEGAMGAGLDTTRLACLGADAPHTDPAELGIKSLRLGAVAPGTAERAALEKYGGTDTGTILN